MEFSYKALQRCMPLTSLWRIVKRSEMLKKMGKYCAKTLRYVDMFYFCVECVKNISSEYASPCFFLHNAFCKEWL